MQTKLLAALVAGSVALSGAAFAATTTVGTIKSLDMTKHQITLQDGTVYMLPSGYKDPVLKVGEKVSITWDMQGQAHQASKVTMAN